jgi:hypothetical protein
VSEISNETTIIANNSKKRAIRPAKTAIRDPIIANKSSSKK